MCLVQDQNYLTRQQGVTRFADIMANDPLRKSKGNSLRSMYSVNKEFSQLASSFLYQELTSERMDEFFQRNILPFHFDKIKKVKLNSSHADRIRAIILLLPLLSPLSILSFYGASQYDIYFSPTLASNLSYSSTLIAASSKITAITLQVISSTLNTAISIVGILKHLRKIALISGFKARSINIDLAQQKLLEENILKSSATLYLVTVYFHCELFTVWSTLDWSSSKVTGSATCEAEAILLASLFCHSLEHLTIHEGSPPNILYTSLPFSSLLYLTLDVSMPSLTMLQCFLSAPLQSLSICITKEFNMSKFNYQKANKIIIPFLLNCPTLRVLKLTFDYATSTTSSPDREILQFQCQKRNIHLLLEEPYSSFITSEMTPEEIDGLNEASNGQCIPGLVRDIQESLEFGKRRIEILEKEGDVNKIYDMMVKLDWLKAQILELRD